MKKCHTSEIKVRLTLNFWRSLDLKIAWKSFFLGLILIS